MSLVKNTVSVGLCTLVSRILGFLRDAVVAFFLGAGAVNDAFIVAFRLPNLFRTIFGEGAFSVAFVPLFSRIEQRQGLGAAEKFAMQVQSILFMVLIIFSSIMIYFMPEIMELTIMGYEHSPQVVELASNLGRITFPYIIFMSFMALYGGILNSMGRFFAFASAPVILNIVQIIAIILAPQGQGAGYALSYGALVAGFLEMLWVYLFTRKAGLKLRFAKPSLSPAVKELLKKIAPGIIGSSIAQINVWVISTLFASFVPAGISYLYYADRVYQLPLALIGTALGTVLLASLAKLIAKKQWAAAHRMQNQALIFSLLFALPAAAGIYALSEEIIKVLFGRGQFDEIAVFQTAQALKVFALALPAFVLMKVLSNSFFAAGDTKTPVKIAALSLLVNMAISWVLLPELKHVAIALGAALSAWLAIFVQALILLKRKQISIYSATYLSAGKITFATAIMFAALKMIADFHLSFYATLTIQISAGALIYFVCLALLGEMKQMKKMLSKEASKLQ